MSVAEMAELILKLEDLVSQLERETFIKIIPDVLID